MADSNIPEFTEGDKADLQGHLDDAFANLNAAVMQMAPSDDEIICDRVRRALAAVTTARHVLREGETARPCYDGSVVRLPMPHVIDGSARIAALERLVLAMTKLVPGDALHSPAGPQIAAVIEDLKRRHPDV